MPVWNDYFPDQEIRGSDTGRPDNKISIATDMRLEADPSFSTTERMTVDAIPSAESTTETWPLVMGRLSKTRG